MVVQSLAKSKVKFLNNNTETGKTAVSKTKALWETESSGSHSLAHI
jgi:hypothetical protein